MAPESIKDQQYNEKTDVYMFGITMWEIMFGRAPFEHLDDINTAMNVVMKDERPEFLWDLPPGMKTLISICWDKDPAKRPTFKEVQKSLSRIQKNLNKKMNKIQEKDAKREKKKKEKEMQQQLYAESHMNRSSSDLALDDI